MSLKERMKHDFPFTKKLSLIKVFQGLENETRSYGRNITSGNTVDTKVDKTNYSEPCHS